MARNPLKFDIETKQARSALREYQRLTGREEDVILTGAAIDTAFQAPNFIPAASEGDIAPYNPRFRASWKDVPYGRSKASAPRLLHATVSDGKGGRWPRQKADPRSTYAGAIKAYQSRQKSRGYHKAMALALIPIIAEKVRASPFASAKAKAKAGSQAGRLKAKVGHQGLRDAAEKLVSVDVRFRGVYKRIVLKVNPKAGAAPMMERGMHKGFNYASKIFINNIAKKYKLHAFRVSGRNAA